MKQIGPIVFLNFGYDRDSNPKESPMFTESQSHFMARLEKNGFLPNLSDLRLIRTKQYNVNVRACFRLSTLLASNHVAHYSYFPVSPSV